MLNSLLIDFYERDIRRLIQEINLYEDEANLWKIHGSIKNPCGNLALHIVGGTNYLIGTTLGNTGYIRNRDQEFSQKKVSRTEIITQLEDLILLIKGTLTNLDMEADYPLVFDDAIRTNAYVLTQLAMHLNYHLGQVNYLRRTLE